MLPVIVRMTTDDERVGEPKLPSLQTSLYVYRWQSNRAASAPSLYSPGPHLSLTYTPLFLLETDSSLFTRTHLSLTYSFFSSGPDLSLKDSSLTSGPHLLLTDFTLFSGPHLSLADFSLSYGPQSLADSSFPCSNWMLI